MKFQWSVKWQEQMQFENVKDCEKESRVSDGKYVKLTLSLIFSRVEGTDEDYIG